MNQADRLAVFEQVAQECRDIMTSKGLEYSRGEEDCLSNFKRVAEALDITPQQAAFVYMAKHWDSVTNYIKTGGKVTSNEPIEGRLNDLVVYLVILRCLIAEVTGPSGILMDAIHGPASHPEAAMTAAALQNLYQTLAAPAETVR